ncbi:MAG: peptidase S41 [Phycisphaerales bacterium]|nr:MAG: peptidase S41 [Phycisphaerales bacterium]
MRILPPKSGRLLLTMFLLLTLALPGTALADEPVGNVDLPRYPALSPNADKVVFSWRGDLWKAPVDGGHAVRLTSHPQNDLVAAWSPDGSRIAFNSTRDGYLNLYVMNADGTDIQQVTSLDRSCSLTGWSVDEDGKEVLTFHALLEADVYRSHRPYMVSVEGGEPQRLHDAFGSEAAVSPDGSRIVFTRGGYYGGWSRRHYDGAESMNLWLYDRESDDFRALTERRGNDGKARWGGERTILFLSDRANSTVNLFRMSAEEGDKVIAQLTNFRERDIHDFDVSADGDTVVFMRWDRLYRLDLTDPDAAPEPIAITASEDDRDNYELKSIAREISEVALSPDGQVMATIAYGRVYIRNVDDKSPTRLVTPDTHARHRNLTWAPDSTALYFVNDEDGTESIYRAKVELTRSEIREAFTRATDPDAEARADDDEEVEDEPNGRAENDAADDEDADAVDAEGENDVEEAEAIDAGKAAKRWHDAVRFTVEPFVQSEYHDRDPTFSPDGSMLSFRRGRGDLMLKDLESGEIRRLVEGWDARLHWRWSPCSQRIAYAQNDLDFSSNIFIIETDGESDPVNITRHPRNDIQPRWSADGRILAFLSNRTENSYDVWRVYLDRDLESLTGRELDAYYDDAAKAARKRKPLDPSGDAEPMESPRLHLEDAWRRLERITSFPGSEFQLELTPAGDRFIFSADIDGRALYSLKWDGTDRKRLTGNADVQHLTLRGNRAVIVHSSRAGTVSVTGGSVDYTDFSDRLRIDLRAQASQMFLEAANLLGEMFYHNEMKGLDWDDLTDQYHQLAKQTRTAHEFSYVAARFLGELNASHLGVRANDPASPLRESSGRLGTIHERIEVGDDRYGYRITDIVRNSPAALGTMALEIGDVILEIDFKPFGPLDTLETHLKGKVGDEVIVTIERTLENGETRTLQTLITPVSYGAFAQLRYRDWRLRNAELVAELSGGRLGYIHIQGMNQPSLDRYERDLYAAAHGTDGLIIDVRNNGGGWTTDRLLASIMIQPHSYTIPRGAPMDATGHYPQDRLFISRYVNPINMLCNEKSFSNAEIISHAFKTLERGTLVGEQTWGGVISTGGQRLIDGTLVRMPFRGWYLSDGTDMENNGAMPDLHVPQTPEDEVRDHDEQLRIAVEDLLQRLED